MYLIFQAFLLAVWTVGAKETCSNLLPRFPGIFLFPLFGPFMFGPKSTGKVCGCSKFGSKQMEVSFFHSYVNIFVWGCGSFLSLLYLDTLFQGPSYFILFPAAVLPILILLAILVVFYNFDKACCYPFTERSLMGNQEESQEKDEETIEMNQLA